MVLAVNNLQGMLGLGLGVRCEEGGRRSGALFPFSVAAYRGTIDFAASDITHVLVLSSVPQNSKPGVTGGFAQGLTRVKSWCWPGCILIWSLQFSKLM